jgi:hypothetical protein
MTKKLIIEIKKIIKNNNLNCSVEEFQDKVGWNLISMCQKLSESFIREFQDKVNWDCISRYQKLSESFIREFQDKVYYEVQYKKHHQILDHKNLAIEYAKKHNLKIDNTYLYAFRNHDMHGRGMFNSAIFYEKGKEYRDFHCDLDSEEQNSFGLGIFPKGNTKVKVKLEDFGVEVKVSDKGKARVWAFEVV